MRVYKYFATIVKYIPVFVLLSGLSYLNRLFSDVGLLITPENMRQHEDIIKIFYEDRQEWLTSNLGTYLYKYTNPQPPPVMVINHPEKGYFNILIWRHWPWLKERHIGSFGTHSVDPLLGCSVTNCKFFENNDTLLRNADAVVVHLQKGLLPDFTVRSPFQRWIFWTDESPRHTFSLAGRDYVPNLRKLANVFNWSMTYRSDSDIPIPYGRTIPLLYPKLNDMTYREIKEIVPYWRSKQSDVLIATIMSRCVGFRMQFVTQLQRFIGVDMFGKCSLVKNHTKSCPGHYKKDCPIISKYIFYLIMENSKCRQYISEKIFHHAYSKGAIPIIMGTPLVDCIKLLPPNSFIHMDTFSSIKELVREIYAVSSNMGRLMSYHQWRNNFEVVEEHGFLETKSLVLCRICEGLNYNSPKRKVYNLDDIHLYLEPAVCCFKDRVWES